MASNVYNVNLLSETTGPTVTITDDGTGIDWLTITGTWSTYTSINLQDTYAANGVATSAWGRYDYPGNTANTLRIIGVIENVRGSNSADFIAGNHANNILYGDAAATGAGGNDTIGGGYGNDTLYGGAGADSLSGAYGNDLIYGGAGNDTLLGNEGNDRLIGGLGADALYGGPGLGNTVDYSASNAAVTVKLTHGSATTGAGGHAAGDLIRGFNNVIGSAYHDRITDTVTGTIAFGYNKNSFSGGAGNDTLSLGGGNDAGYGGVGSDMLFGGVGSDRLYGEVGSDRLYGGVGDDGLVGGSGVDSLYGDLGLDRLTGGISADRFIYRTWGDSSATSAGRDIIFDFHRSEADKIDLGLLDPAGAATAMTFRGALAYNGVAGALRTVTSGANSYVFIDKDGDRDTDFSLLVIGVTRLIATDFLL